MADQTSRESKAENEQQLLFIVGMWRSGTSLIHSLLNQHPQIALMYEAEPMDFWPFERSSGSAPGWPERLEFYNQTISRHKFTSEMFAGTRPGREAALALYREYGRSRNAKVIGEKAPAYYARLPMLGRVFPEAKFVVVWRDPIECCRSAVKAGEQNRFFAQRGMMNRLLLGSERLAEGAEWLQREKRCLHEVVYNELVANTEGELRRVCDFLGLPFDAGMLDLKSADTSSVPPGEHHDRVRSGTIAKTIRGPDPLPPGLAEKGLRYGNAWRGRFGNLGFARGLATGVESRKPAFGESLIDRAAHAYWTLLDGFKHVLFRYIPLSWWWRIRIATPRGNRAAENELSSKP